MTTPEPKKVSTKSSLIGGAAFLAGYLAGGTGVVPVSVDGVEAADPDWDCEVVGPALHGQRVCHPKQDDKPSDSDTPIVLPLPDAGN